MDKRSLLRRSLLAALAVAVLLSFAGVFQHELWTPDEPREAEVGREMWLSNFSAMPTLGGTPFLEKPPLFAWATAASYEVFGVSTYAGRLPSALFAVAAIWVAYLLGRRTAGRLAGLCSAAVLGTMWQFAETTHKIALDVPLVFFVGAGHLAFLRLRDGTSRWNYAILGAAAGLSFLTKSFIGPALMCAPPMMAAAATRDWAYVKRVLPRAAGAALVGVIAIGLPWVMALVHTPGAGWSAVRTCLWTNTIGRSVAVEGDDTGFSGHANGPFYYAPVVLYIVAPWILALPAIVKGGLLRRDRRGGRVLFLGLVYVAGALLLSIPSGKRALYLVPLLPAAAVVPGVWLSRIGTRNGGAWDAWTITTLRVVATTVFVALVAAMTWVMFGGHLPESAAELAAHRSIVLPHLVAAGLWILGPNLFVRRRVIPAAARGLHVAAAFVNVLLVYQAAVCPVIDPIRNMSDGAREVAALIPADEKIVTLHADETTRAILPFYTGREFENADEADDAMKAIEEGRAKHLVVTDKAMRRLTPPLKRRLTLVKTVAVSATRDLSVYAVTQ